MVQLKTEEDVIAFLDNRNEWAEKTKFFEKSPVSLADLYRQRKTKTRVIAFIYDKEDYPDEVKNLRLTGRLSAKRDELRIGLVTDKKIIKKYKAKYGTQWFPDASYSTVVLKRYDGQTYMLDLLAENSHMHFQFWVNKKSIN